MGDEAVGRPRPPWGTMHKSELYRCGSREIWQRQTGNLHPIAFARKSGGCEDLIKRLKLFTKLEWHDGCVNTVHFNPSGELLVSASDDTEIVIWDWAANIRKLSYPSGHHQNVFQARIMPFSDDRSIVSCAADGQVRHGEISETGRVTTKKLAKHRGRAHKLAIEPGSPRTFFSCGEDGVVQHFDLREEKSTKLFTCNTPGRKHRRSKSVVRLNTIAINPRNPHYFAIGGSDEYARVYDIRKVAMDGADVQPVDCFSPAHLVGDDTVHITCVAYSQQEELLASYNDELVYLFDKDMGMGPDPLTWQKEHRHGGGEPIQDPKPLVFVGHRNSKTVKGVNFFGPNTEYVVSGSDCGWIYIWRKRDGKLVNMLHGDAQVVNCLEPHPFITVLATSGIERDVKIWTPTSDRLGSLPADANKTMEKNRREREEGPHISHIEPRVFMHVMRLQSRAAERDRQVDRLTMHSAEFDIDDHDHDYGENADSNSSDEDSSDEGSRMGPRECIIS